MADTTAFENLPATTGARAETVQARVREGREAGFSILNFLAGAGFRIPAWWSPTRDAALRRFWKESDHLSGALYTMIAKMTSIPFQIVPVDPSNPQHALEAEERSEALRSGAEFGEGWQVFYAKFIEDLLSQDNGAFAEIIGPGNPDGPLTGKPYTIAHMDSWRCQRTGNPEYPVIYRDVDGTLYRMHYTRVIYASQMPSPIAEMFGVGFCAVSRCINVAQTLIDILVYKQEKLGSRPYRAIIYTKGGLDPDDVGKAFQVAELGNTSSGLSRYSRIPVIGSQTIPDAELGMLELSKLPEGFNEETSLTLGMATIALAFGVDARELFPSLSSGSTRADALLQHLKQRGKGPGQILESMEALINFKYLPSYLKIKFDFQDDAEDQQAADIRHTRAQTRQSDMTAQVLNARTARQQMVADGEITAGQFEQMELEDGRLVNGTSVLSLFYIKTPPYSEVLALGVENPEDTFANDAEEMFKKIAKQRMAIHEMTAATRNFPKQTILMQCEAALNALQKLYEKPPVIPMTSEEAMQAQMGQAALPGGGRGALPGVMRDTRQRRTNPAKPNIRNEVNTGTGASGNVMNKPTPNKNEQDKELALLEDIPTRVNAALARFNAAMTQAEKEAHAVPQNGHAH